MLLKISGYGIDSSLITKELSQQASEALVSIDYKDYHSKVIEFLAEDEKQNYSGPDLWQEIQTEVLELIQQ